MGKNKTIRITGLCYCFLVFECAGEKEGKGSFGEGHKLIRLEQAPLFYASSMRGAVGRCVTSHCCCHTVDVLWIRERHMGMKLAKKGRSRTLALTGLVWFGGEARSTNG